MVVSLAHKHRQCDESESQRFTYDATITIVTLICTALVGVGVVVAAAAVLERNQQVWRSLVR